MRADQTRRHGRVAGDHDHVGAAPDHGLDFRGVGKIGSEDRDDFLAERKRRPTGRQVHAPAGVRAAQEKLSSEGMEHRPRKGRRQGRGAAVEVDGDLAAVAADDVLGGPGSGVPRWRYGFRRP